MIHFMKLKLTNEVYELRLVSSPEPEVKNVTLSTPGFHPVRPVSDF